ncbi:Sugar transferases involved in lipopolysaccharide synthesis [Polynucleobacter duraquae]|uniref:Sugar transferases involved in lipopolysaccharide synthesis n=1 Tax=Polynucleobacter duraquae TaxID=1835254 RepID=A0A0E3V0K2_9BURK|nr:sugar transferase [Polynucleobacter duraquae]AKD24663.1 Sugar transferases involved in lipopolysaccharide synthesis [Polynucleobacter duraquae]
MQLLSRLSALLMLITLSPIFLLICIAILLSSGRPIFYISPRIGRHCKEFRMFKFRTMHIKTPEIATHLIINPDNYITNLGFFLRKSSLDEIPQLINILIGDMCFVGPRPALFNQYDLITYRQKYNVDKLKPGITGLAQINGRDKISIRRKVAYDLLYYKSQSIILDLQIILITAKKLINSTDISH